MTNQSPSRLTSNKPTAETDKAVRGIFDVSDLEEQTEAENRIIELMKQSNPEKFRIYMQGKEAGIMWGLSNVQRIKSEVEKVIDEMLAEGLNGQRYNFMLNGEELKKRLGIK